MVDVGTSTLNSGVDALAWHKQDSSRVTIGFEAHPSNCANVHHAFNASGQRFVCKAISDKRGSAVLVGSGQGGSLASAAALPSTSSSDDGGPETVVPVTTLDEELPNERVWVLKLDLQGGEVHALRGARALLERRVAWVYAELDPHLLRASSTAGRPSSARALLDLLDARGFACINSRRRNAHPTLGYHDPLAVKRGDNTTRRSCGYSCPCRYTNVLCGHRRVAIHPPKGWKEDLLREMCAQPNCVYREQWRGLTPLEVCSAPRREWL